MKRLFARRSDSLRRGALPVRRLLVRHVLARLRGLSFRLVAIVSAIVLLGILASSLLNVYMHRRQLLAGAQENAGHLGDVLQASLRHGMRANDRAALQDMVDTVAAETQVRRVQILDAQGAVKISPAASDLGQTLRLADSPCDTCHGAAAAGTDRGLSLPNAVARAGGNDERARAALTGSKIMGSSLFSVRLILNEPECHSCHAPAEPILGMLLMESSISDLQEQMAQSLGWSALVAALALALMIGLLVPWLARSVLGPVQALAEGAAAISRGDLDRPLGLAPHAPGPRDELGQLAGSFEHMRRQLAAWRAELERRQAELQTLNDVARAASHLLDPQQILDLSLDVIMSSFPVEAGALYLSDPDCGQFVVRGQKAAPDQNRQAFLLLLAARTFTGHARGEDGAFFETERLAPDGGFRVWRDDEGRRYVVVGLHAGAERLGALVLCTHAGQALTVEGIETLRAIGLEVGLALANALDFQRLRYTATVEERSRMAREMHDSLAQNLGYLKLKATMTDRLLSQGQIDEARANLQEVRALAGETYTDVRESIFALRRSAAGGADFLPSLVRYLEDYRAYYKLNVELLLDQDGPAGEVGLAGEACRPAFADEPGSQIMRIIQEALSNARKHAAAQQVRVRIGRDAGCWQISVEDDGRGFDPESFAAGGRSSFGLQIMRERAASIGGRLDVFSRPGEGARVCLTVPDAAERGNS